MGRSVPTYRMVMEDVIREWGQFRRALRRDDQVAFDRMVNRARAHGSAGSYLGGAIPVETMFLSILVDMEKEIQALTRIKNDGRT